MIILLSDGAANGGANCPAKRRMARGRRDGFALYEPVRNGVSDGASYQATGVAVYREMTAEQEPETLRELDGALSSRRSTPQAALSGWQAPGDFFTTADPTTLARCSRA